MGRQARKLSATGFYHIMFRGINRQHLFDDEGDYRYFFESMARIKTDMYFELHAYCLMSNHVHLLIREKQMGDISTIMKRLLTKYVMYFNSKYERSGALIASRYKSVPVEVDEYFISLICYIHQNPVRAGMVKELEAYRYSSYREYVHGGSMVETSFSLNLLGKDEWMRLHANLVKNNFEVSGRISLSEEEIHRKILRYTKGQELSEIVGLPRTERNALLKCLKEKEGLSIRQIERATGISRRVIAKA